MKLGKLIREALAAAGGKLTFRKLHEEVGGDDAKLKKALYNLKYNGKVAVADDDEITVTLKAGKSAPPQGRRAKPAGKKKTVKRARKTPAQPASQFRDIVVRNLVGAGALLCQAVEDGVEGLDTNHGLRQAMENYFRAQEIFRASALA